MSNNMRTAIVTGGANGIGQAVGVALCAAGWAGIADGKVETVDLSEPGDWLRASHLQASVSVPVMSLHF
jgi:NAD(P)-dependent dehydrogenase (short-subunit alcohol dehydrogenase family)